MADKEQNIFAELTFRGIKDGVQWQKSIIEFPRQSEIAYTVMEQALMDMMKSFGGEIAKK